MENEIDSYLQQESDFKKESTDWEHCINCTTHTPEPVIDGLCIRCLEEVANDNTVDYGKALEYSQDQITFILSLVLEDEQRKMWTNTKKYLLSKELPNDNYEGE